MTDKSPISELIRQAASLLPDNAANVREEFERNLRPLVEASLAKLDIVTRQEFDHQLALLRQLQQRADDLEQELATLRAANGDQQETDCS